MRMSRAAFLTILATLVLSAPVSASASSPTITNFWPADGNAKDLIGGNNGTLVNGASFGPGVYGFSGDQAFSLNGTNQYVQATSAVPFGANDFTIDLWANFNAVSPGNGIGGPGSVLIADDNGPGCQDKWFFALGGGVLNFHINNPSCGGPVSFLAQYPFAPTLHRWYNLAVSRQAGTVRIYVNGVQASSQFTTLTSTPTAPLTIGFGESGAASGYFNGRIDDVQIYNFGITASALTALTHGG